MNTDVREIRVRGVSVRIVRKAIKNLHLGVYPPNGRVRVAAPLAVSDNAVRLAVVGKLGWIKRQRNRFDSQQREPLREMGSGESHYFLGRRLRLRVAEQPGPSHVSVRGTSRLELTVPPGCGAEKRLQILECWYRRRLREIVPPLLSRWQENLGVQARRWGIKRMKTKWGACNPSTRRIWLNLELAKKPICCLEYVVVHELVHLLERKHNGRFTALLDEFLPRWRAVRALLNSAPLSHQRWTR